MPTSVADAARLLLWVSAVAAGLLAARAGFAGDPRASTISGTSTVFEDASFDSPALRRPLGYALYLPPGYDGAGAALPVIYLLHGVGGDRYDWLRYGRLRETADRLIAERAIPPAIVVMPDGAVGWWVDSEDVGGPGNYETAIDRDLVGEIERRFAARSDPGGRAVGGLSMGAYGALRFALRPPRRYAAAAGLSPALWLRIAPDTPTDERLQRVFRGAFGSPFRTDRFLALSPRAMIESMAREDVKPSIFLIAGSRDFPSLRQDTEQLSERLDRAGFSIRYRILDGGHDWQLWADALPDALTFLGDALRAR
ncbi:MAG: hypothetical protein JNL04_19980 [Rhodospirillaceae bacterium]|nr:hypothetical protein [Rhodospirillaceae bacterium]